jgi:hypothetical protein
LLFVSSLVVVVQRFEEWLARRKRPVSTVAAE